MTKEKLKENFCGPCAAGAALGAAIAGAAGVKASETEKNEKIAGMPLKTVLWGLAATIGLAVIGVLLLKSKGKKRRKK